MQKLSYVFLILYDSLACKLCAKTDNSISWKSCWRTLIDYILLMTSSKKPKAVEGWNAFSANDSTNFYQETSGNSFGIPLVSPWRASIFAAPFATSQGILRGAHIPGDAGADAQWELPRTSPGS